MSKQRARVLAGALGASALYVGVWATIWPQSFFTTFPGVGQTWVAPLGPYNEHLVRDVGGLYLGLSVLSLWATRRPEPSLVRATGAVWLAFGVPHVLFHLAHRDGLADVDWVASLTLLLAAVVAAAMLALARDEPSPTRLTRAREEVSR